MQQTTVFLQRPQLRLKIGIRHALRAFFLLVGFASAATAAENHALLVGIDKYPRARPLKGAVNDIRQIRRLLTEDLKFPEANVRVLLDEQATKANILRALEDLAARTKAGDMILWYYSGHGWVQRDENGDEAESDPDDRMDEVLVPFDATPWPRDRAIEPNTTMVLDDELAQRLSRLLGRRIVIVFDSCHSGTATRALPGQEVTRSLYENYPLPVTPKTRSLRKGRDILDIKGQVIFIAAASPVESASDMGEFEGQRHGAFTASLLRATKQLGQDWQHRVSWERLFQMARDDMLNQGFANQTPSFSASRGLGKLPVEQFLRPLPSSEIASLGGAGSFDVQMGANQYQFEEGEFLELAVESARDGYLYLFDINAEQSVTQLFPNRHQTENRIKAGVARAIPDKSDPYQFRAGKPFGRSTVVAIVTTNPWAQADRLELPADFRALSDAQKNGLRNLMRALQDSALPEGEGGAKVTEWASQRAVVDIKPKGGLSSAAEPPEGKPPAVPSATPVSAAVPPAPTTPVATAPAGAVPPETASPSGPSNDVNLTSDIQRDLPRRAPALFARLERLAERFSPVFWQDVGMDLEGSFRPWRDFFVRYDFDVTEQGPNWPEPPRFQDERKRSRSFTLNALLSRDPRREVSPSKETPGIFEVLDKQTSEVYRLDLRPVVYWAVLTTPTHYFFHYVAFHAEDWKSMFGHTGDMEGTTIVVDRQTEKMVAAFTLAHDDVGVVRGLDDEPEGNIGVLVNPAVEARDLFDGEDGRPVDGSLSMEAVRDGEAAPKEHQDIYVESKGHGHHGPHKIKQSRYIIYASYFPDETFAAPSFDRAKYPLTNRFAEVLSKHKYQLFYIGSPSGAGARSADDKSLWGEYRDLPRFPGGVNPPWDWKDNLFFKTGWWKDPRTIKKIGSPYYLLNPYLQEKK